MEKGGAAKPKDEKTESKDLRVNPQNKFKLPAPNRPVVPPPVKDKPHNFTSGKVNGDLPTLSPGKEADQFDGVEVSPDKLNHPTANRAKPPHRRPPSALITGPQGASNQAEAEKSPVLRKVGESPQTKLEQPPKSQLPAKQVIPKLLVDSRAAPEKPSLDSLHAEVKELKMALELLQNRHERDIQELKEELRDEKNKRTALQEEVHGLKTKHCSAGGASK